MAWIQCLAIRTADPRSVCWAGGTLAGDVSLVLSDPTLIRGIRLSYRCEGRVDFLGEGEEMEGQEDGGKGHQAVRAFYNAVVSPRHHTAMEKFLETTTILWGTEPTTSYGEVMPAGCHSLEFEINVPHSLPASFEGRYGFVRHWLECVLDRPGAPEMMTSRALSVICNSDLNRDPTATKMIRHHESVVLCCGCLRPDQYEVSYELAYRGYVPGETMFPDVRVRNFTRNTIVLTVSLLMITTFRAKKKTKATSRVLVEEQKEVHKTEVIKWEPSLEIPGLPPTGLGGCHVIDVRYFLQVDLSSRGLAWQGVAFQDEIRIGTIPLRHVANVRQAQVRVPMELTTPQMVLLVDQTAPRLPLLPTNASSSSTGDGHLASDADSGTLHTPKLAADVTSADNGGRQRATSIISTSSHWSFHPHAPMGLPRLHPGFLDKLAAKREARARSKGFVPKLPTIYSV